MFFNIRDEKQIKQGKNMTTGDADQGKYLRPFLSKSRMHFWENLWGERLTRQSRYQGSIALFQV